MHVRRSSYDALSRWYDLLANGSERRLRQQGLEMLSPRVGEAILEIGPGTGHALLALSRFVGGSASVLGLDLSVGMLRVAQSRVRRAGLAARVALLHADAADLPLVAHCLDAVFMSFTLELFDAPDAALVLSECQRVLRHGGRVCVVAMAEGSRAGLVARLYAWAHRTFPACIDCRPIRVRETLTWAGLQVVEWVKTSTWGLPVEIVLARRA
jgi:demethylmenaquinone methyltransferase/2-methoxy-6-polyprenyl-1,4-benzoquinol methylase